MLTREEVMLLALEYKDLTDFANACFAAGAAAEREACATLCHETAIFAMLQAKEGGSAIDDGRAFGAQDLESEIRARGAK